MALLFQSLANRQQGAAFCPRCGQALEGDQNTSPARLPGQAEQETTQLWLGGSTDEMPAYRTPEELRCEYSFLAEPLQPTDLGRLGQYRVLRVLGKGGMGVVFQGEDTRLQRPVAIKALLPALADQSDNRERFLREARATASLTHEHIVTIYAVEPDVPYLVMQLLQGETLEACLKRQGPLPIPSVLRIGREIAEGLSAAHERGMVHRDIKPANIWLETPPPCASRLRLSRAVFPAKPQAADGGGGVPRVKILDFGLARLPAGHPQAGRSNLTQSGLIVGTPAYMAPEQARGAGVDARTDLFSLGCVLYKALTNRLPFPGKDVLSVLIALVTADPTPIQELNPAVPSGLIELIDQLLDRDPAQRPGSAHLVAELLSHLETTYRPSVLGPLTGDQPLPELAALADEEKSEPARPAPQGQPKPLPELPASGLADLSGCILGRFLLGRVLGRGFHGVVFQAHDQKHERTLAVKVLSPEFPRNESEIQRFIQAMKTALPLRHPNLVSLHKAGRTGPYCWIALDLVEGGSLRELIRRHTTGQLGCRPALRLALQIGRVLVLASQHRIIHGNITPSNILIRGADQSALLNDLTLARALRRSQLEQRVLESKLQAEVGFLAPEQVDSESSYVDHLCDIYSLGAIIYLLLTGREPFKGPTLEDTLAEIRAGSPVRPRKLNRSIPASLEWVVLKMLARRQEERYQSPAEMLADLEKLAERPELRGQAGV